ncbi:hypothetical protein MTO98_02725 [Mucilaginibacter sp. SMC90]|uniref:hypothetical protein n=1 Tax=Mucilaginibacter sp. SMC90 TaxID=2929803 RepID=UPI001FB3B0E9|nr:hypothetical protein [Mucilaginibacter sp. SMC90]UOE49984.1 hypothetical protein MTO98_02725 [Mucilaginibacter sp. SMC90]
MNIDDLKDAWHDDEPQGMHLPADTQTLGKTNSVIDKVRSNMKSEFIATVMAYPILIWYLMSHHRSSFFFNLAIIIFFTIFILNTYFYARFYVFYKSIAKYDFNIRESIRKITYELELNTEIYKTYNFCVTPLAILLIVALFCSQSVSKYILQVLTSDAFLSAGGMLWFVLTAIVTVVITYAIHVYYIKSLYGKHIVELKQIIDDLGSEP